MRRMRAIGVLCTLLVVTFAFAGQARAAEAPGSETTDSGGDLRTGWYPNEPSITPELVSSGTFGRLWTTPVEGQVYAQPLLDDGTLFVGTEENYLYGLNPATGAVQWSQSLGEPWNPAEISCGDLAPHVGVTATPVIDPATHVAYLTYKTYKEKGKDPEWFMDAVNVSTGKQQPGFPVLLAGTAQNAPGQEFKPGAELQRPGLLLMEGVIYAGFGSDCDTPPWQGWVFGVSTEGAVKARWVADETGNGGGIWQSGSGLASDGPGTILLSTGNGGAPSPPVLGDEPPGNLGESIVRLDVQPGGSLKAVDFFAPYNATYLDTWDADFASGGVTGLPEEYFGTPAVPHLAVAVGKDGYVYLLNRDALGGIGEGPSGSDDVVQRIGPYGGVWSRPGVWPGEGGWVYIPTASAGTSGSGSSGNLRVYEYGLSGSDSPTLSLQATSSEAFGFSSSAPVITSDETTPGSALVWMVWAPNGGGEGAQLRAYDPIPVDGQPVLRWSAPVGTAAKFAVPGVGAGRLYVGTRDGHVLAFGSPVTPILSGSTTVFPTTTVGASSQRTLTLTATEPLTLSSVKSSSTQFTIGSPSSPLPDTLSTGQTVEVPITFSPTGSGPLGATLTATTSTGKTVNFGLSGIGQTAGAKLEATPLVVTFTGTAVGDHASAGATFRNVGGEPLTINHVALPSAPFAAEGAPAPGTVIAPGHSITITVTFEPTTPGSFSGEIGLETTAGNEAVGLSGTAGLPGAIKVESESVEYGAVAIGSSETESFTVTNTGGTAVPITKSKPPIGGEFTATTSLPEGTTIEPGESLTETVKFTPTTTGPASAMWPINGEDTTGLHEVKFSGEGVAPAALEASTKSLGLGSTSVGSTLSGEVTFRNTGGEPLTINKVKPLSTPFAAEDPPTPGTVIAPGDSITLTLTFTPTAPGKFSGEFGLETTAGNAVVDLTASAVTPGAIKIEGGPLEYGKVTVGSSETKSFTITNTGGTPVPITKSTPPTGGAFTATTSLLAGTTIEPGESRKETVEFTPTATGPTSAVWSIEGKDTTGLHEVKVSGEGVARPMLEASTESLELGSTSVGSTLSGEVTFRNTGGAALTVKKVTPLSTPFAAEDAPTPGTVIEPGRPITVTVRFTPTTAGTFSGEFGLETTAGNAVVDVTASAVTPGAIKVEGGPLEYGKVTVGSSETKSFTITNTGGTPVPITKSTPPTGGAFAATTSLPAGTTIEPGESREETVEFMPTTTGPTSAAWSIEGMDTTGLHEVLFNGEGVAAPATFEVPTPPSTTPTTSLVSPLGGTLSFTETKEPVLSLTRLQFRAQSAQKSHKQREIVSYALSTAATVVLAVYRQTTSHRCTHGARTCSRWIPTGIRRKASGHQGANSLSLNLASLPAGTYRLDATPVARSGVSGQTLSLHFHRYS